MSLNELWYNNFISCEWRIAARYSRRERNRSRIWYHPSTNCWKNSRGGKRVSYNFSQSMCSYGKTSLRVSNSNSSSENLFIENLERTIFNLSLSKYDANFSRLILRNLKKSIKLNFSKFFSFLSLIDMFSEWNVFFLRYWKEICIFIVHEQFF